MFGPCGRAYIYFTYGNHHLLNVVTGKKGEAGAVLIRAVEPIDAIKIMKNFRPVKNEINLTNGPGKLTKAFNITKRLNGIDLTNSILMIARKKTEPKFNIGRASRIGIKTGLHLLERYYIVGNKYVSVKPKNKKPEGKI